MASPWAIPEAITYYELYREVNKLANALKSMGVEKGDRVVCYLPMIPELPITMLACAKIGAIHTVVFSGFSSGGLNSRVNDAEAKVVVTADGFFRRGKPLPLKPNVDEALKTAPSIKKVVVVKRTGVQIPMTEGRDIYYDDFVKGQSAQCETVQLDPEDRLFILYTSGTTGKPKGIEHAHGGYAVLQLRPAPGYWIFTMTMSTGAQLMPAGSPDTATLSTARSVWELPASSTRVLPTSLTWAAGGPSLSNTASPCSIPHPRPSGCS